MLNQTEVTERIARGIDQWNAGDIEGLLANFADDIAYCSPHIDENAKQQPSVWLQGREEIAAHHWTMRRRFPHLKLDAVLFGEGFVTVLLESDDRRLSMCLEADDRGLARRAIVCAAERG